MHRFLFIILIFVLSSNPLLAEDQSCKAEKLVRYLVETGLIHPELSSKSPRDILHQAMESHQNFLRTHSKVCQTFGICGKRLELGNLKLKNGGTIGIDLFFFLNEEFIYAHIMKDAGSHTMTFIYDGFHFVLRFENPEVLEWIRNMFDPTLQMKYFQPTRVEAGQHRQGVLAEHALLLEPDEFRRFLIQHQSLIVMSSQESLHVLETDVNHANTPTPRSRKNIETLSSNPISRSDLQVRADSASTTLGGTTYFFKDGKVIGYCKSGRCFLLHVLQYMDVASHEAILREQGIIVVPTEALSRPAFEKGRERIEAYIKEHNVQTHNDREIFDVFMLHKHLWNLLNRELDYVSSLVRDEARLKLMELVEKRRVWIDAARESAQQSAIENHQIFSQVYIDPTQDEVPVEIGKLYRFAWVSAQQPKLILTRKNVLHDQMLTLVLGPKLIRHFLSPTNTSTFIYELLRGGTFVIRSFDVSTQHAVVQINQSRMTLMGRGENGAPYRSIHIQTADIPQIKAAIANYLGIPASNLDLNFY